MPETTGIVADEHDRGAVIDDGSRQRGARLGVGIRDDDNTTGQLPVCLHSHERRQ